MQEVTNSNGTFRSIANNNKNKIAGKTGTAQVFSLKNQEYDEDNIADHLKDHSLFIGYAPYDNPQISIAVIIENGGLIILGGNRHIFSVSKGALYSTHNGLIKTH